MILAAINDCGHLLIIQCLIVANRGVFMSMLAKLFYGTLKSYHPNAI